MAFGNEMSIEGETAGQGNGEVSERVWHKGLLYPSSSRRLDREAAAGRAGQRRREPGSSSLAKRGAEDLTLCGARPGVARHSVLFSFNHWRALERRGYLVPRRCERNAVHREFRGILGVLKQECRVSGPGHLR